MIHVHGVADGKDHRDASSLAEGMLGVIIGALAGGRSQPRVLTLEVFSEAAFAQSAAVIKEFVP